MKQTVTTESMINYLQYKLNQFEKENAKYGMDKHTEALFDEMIACKEMVEALIEMPVNLQKDGKVTVGF